MTDQQQLENSLPTEPLFSVEEVQNAFAKSYGMTIGPLTFQCLKSEKQIMAQQTYIAQAAVNEAELDRQIKQLVAGAVAYEVRIHELEVEVARLIKTGPTAEHIAAQGDAIIAEARIEEAAPVDGKLASAEKD